MNLPHEPRIGSTNPSSLGGRNRRSILSTREYTRVPRPALKPIPQALVAPHARQPNKRPSHTRLATPEAAGAAVHTRTRRNATRGAPRRCGAEGAHRTAQRWDACGLRRQTTWARRAQGRTASARVHSTAGTAVPCGAYCGSAGRQSQGLTEGPWRTLGTCMGSVHNRASVCDLPAFKRRAVQSGQDKRTVEPERPRSEWTAPSGSLRT